jgi:HD-like signal output (HDOD) protein
MSDSGNKETDVWQQLLQDTDLRAMSGVIRRLEFLIGSDSTTPKQLANVVLQDVTLTSRVLLVANSVTHHSAKSVNGEGSLTRAIVRIGFNGLRAICISSAIMDTFLKRSPHSSEIQSVIAESFKLAVYSRVVARRLAVNEEEVFIAGLLQNFGELIFWSSRIPASADYKKLQASSEDNPGQIFKALSGKDFQDLSIALAAEWKLSPLLLESFGGIINASTKALNLGVRLSVASRYGWDSPQATTLLQEHQDVLGVDLETCVRFMREGEAEIKMLSSSYNLNSTDELSKEDVALAIPLGADDLNIVIESKPKKTKKISSPLIRE